MTDAITDDLIPTRKPPHRKITMSDVQAIAKMVARGMTETEAAHRMDIQQSLWFNWKNRAKRCDKFNEILARMKSCRIDTLLGEIDKAASGSEGVRHDWRAADRLLSIADSRFSQANRSDQTTVNVSLVSPDRMEIISRMVRERVAQIAGSQVQPKSIPKSIEDSDKQVDKM